MARTTTAGTERGIVEQEPPDESEQARSRGSESVKSALLAAGALLAGGALAVVIWRTYRPFRGC